MNLSVIWRLQDLMTPVMNRVAKTARTTQDVVERVNSRMSSGFKSSAHSVDGLREKINALTKYRDGLKIGVDGSEIRRANQELNLLQNKMDKVTNMKGGKKAGLIGGLGGLKGMAVGYGLYEAVGVGQNMLNDGMNMDKAEESLRYFTGNVAKANNIIEQLKAYSNKYAMYNRGDLVESASMIATTMGADSVGRITQMVGKLAQGNTANFKGIITRLQQIKGTGYLQGDELMELLNRGVFGLQEEISRFKNISIQKFNKLKEAQMISYADVESALIRMTSAGGKYDKILDVIAKTTYGKWATIRNTVKSRATDIGKSTVGALNGALDWVIRFLQNSAPIGAAFDRMGKAFKPLLNGAFKLAQGLGLISGKGDSVTKTVEFISNVVNRLAWVINAAGKAVEWVGNMFIKYPWLKYAAGFFALSYGIGAVTDKIGNLKLLIQSGELLAKLPFGFIASGFSVIARAMAFLWANPIGLIVLGVMALGAAIYYAWNHSENFRRITIQTWEGLKFLWNSAVLLVSQAWSKIYPIMILIGQVWNNVMTWLKTSGLMAWAYITSIFQTLTAPIVWAFEKVKPYISGFWDWFKDKALTAIRGVAAISTFGLSEIGIGLFKKFKIGYDKGAATADQFEKQRSLLAKGKPAKKGGFFK